MLQSNTRFSSLGLSPATMRAMTEGFGYEFCTPVQEQSIPVAMAGFDVLARARTGTGKTLAFMIPAVEKLIKSNERRSLGSVRCTQSVHSPLPSLAVRLALCAKVATVACAGCHPGAVADA